MALYSHKKGEPFTELKEIFSFNGYADSDDDHLSLKGSSFISNEIMNYLSEK